MRGALSGWELIFRTATAIADIERNHIMTEKIAVPLSGTPSIVLLNNGERMTLEKALKARYRIADAASLSAADTQPGKVNALSAWRANVLAVPEAKGRVSAATQLIEEQPLMSIDRVRAFLRGLPTEQTDTTEEIDMTIKEDPARAARRAEIAASMQSFNRSRGFARPVRAAAKPAVHAVTADPVKLRRLAEIRLAALQHNGEMVESKKLKYALDVQSQTGAPLVNVFATLGVDTSKFAQT